MPQADIEINGVASSNEDLPINTLVQLSNNDAGDETTYTWEIVNQPEGPADALSNTGIENPTITPQKEDTYLIRLTVDQGLPTEVVDTKLFRVRRFKTDAVLVAVGEAQAGTKGAWSFDQNETLNKLLQRLYTGQIIVAQAAGPITVGAVVQLDDTNTIKAGLPGEERVPRASNVNATDPAIASKVVGVALGQPNGSGVVIAGDMLLVRVNGLLDLPNVGAPALGDPVFVSDAGTLALAQGTNRRKIGTVTDATPGAWRAFLSTLTEEAGVLPVHALGGPFHGADTLANLNSKVIGGNLDFDTASRPPSGPAGGGLSGNYPNPTLNLIFGTDYSYVEDIPLSTTTSAVFQNKLQSLTGALTGTYRVAWWAVVRQTNTGDAVQARLFEGFTASQIGAIQEIEPKDVNDRKFVGGFHHVVLSAQPTNYIIQWREQRGSTAGIEDAHIEIWRVA